MIKRIIVIGDSLAANRKGDNLSDKNRWPNILQEDFGFEILNLAKPYSTSKILRKYKSLKVYNKFDCIIVQLGIVDCVPRIFYRWEYSLLSRLPLFIRKYIIKGIKKKRKRRKNRVYVRQEKFMENINLFCSSVKIPIIFIKILSASKAFSMKNRNAETNIFEYNRIIEKVCAKYNNKTFVEFNKKEVEKLTLSDGYHLNEYAHKYTANKLACFIKDYNER